MDSMHNHTLDSDGMLSHLGLLQAAEALGYNVIGITDHDVLPGPEAMDQLRSYQGPVRWFAGVELSSGYPHEMGGGASNALHILGLFIDPTNPELVRHCAQLAGARVVRMERTVANLQGLGFDITPEECLREAGGPTVAKPHIVAALIAKPHNMQLLNEHRERMRLAGQTDPGIAARYEQMMKMVDIKGDGQLVYPLFLQTGAFVPDINVEYVYFTDLDETVRLIRAAGGVAIVAHWWTVRDELDAELLEKLIVEGRLDGLETITSFDAEEAVSGWEVIAGIARRTDCLVTPGADAHDVFDLQHFAGKTLAAQTAGMTRRLLERRLLDQRPLDLRWSNLAVVEPATT